MSLSELVTGKKSVVSWLIELGGLAIAAMGLIWIGEMKEKVAFIEKRLERIEARQLAGVGSRLPPYVMHAGNP